jgi:hypothetical protein
MFGSALPIRQTFCAPNACLAARRHAASTCRSRAYGLASSICFIGRIRGLIFFGEERAPPANMEEWRAAMRRLVDRQVRQRLVQALEKAASPIEA